MTLPPHRRLVLAALLLALAGCGGGRVAPEPTGAVSPPASVGGDAAELPQEAVPPGVKPISREVEDLGQP